MFYSLSFLQSSAAQTFQQLLNCMVKLVPGVFGVLTVGWTKKQYEDVSLGHCDERFSEQLIMNIISTFLLFSARVVIEL